MKHSRIFPAALFAGALVFGAGRAPAGHEEDRASRFRQMDTDGDGRISAAEHAAQAGSTFAKMDTDHDGLVTVAEMDACRAQDRDAALRSNASAQPEGADRLGSGAARADGSVSSHEVANARDATPAEPTATEKIRLADGDGDGRLSAAEHEAGAVAQFARLDANGDGLLTPAECDAGPPSLGSEGMG